MSATPTPWPDLPELERRLELTEQHIRQRRERDYGDADTVMMNLQARAASYERGIREMRRHGLEHLGSNLWRCACGANGRGGTTAQARKTWGRHVEDAVWGARG